MRNLLGGLSLVVPAGTTLGNLTLVEQLNVATGASQVLRASLGNEALSVVNRVVVSPDGSTLAFDGRTGAGTQRIFVGPLSGGAVTQATEHTGADALANDSHPCFVSPGLLAFSSDAGGASQVYELTLPANRQAGVLAVPSAAGRCRHRGHGHRDAAWPQSSRGLCPQTDLLPPVPHPHAV